MAEKVVLVAFNGEPMCFAHVLLNALDMKERGLDVKVVVEGTATKMIASLSDPNQPFAELYERVKAANLIDCVCKACAAKMGALAAAESQGLQSCGGMSGHPSLARYIQEGYRVITR